MPEWNNAFVYSASNNRKGALVMKHKQLLEKYLAALEAGSYEGLMELFEPDGVVLSPLYGQMPAREFYRDLFEDTRQSKLTLLDTLESNENGNSCGVHFIFDWTLADGTLFPFECVDMFEVSPAGRFSKLTIIYDTAGVRDTFNNLE